MCVCEGERGPDARASSIGLSAPNELGVELRDGNRRNLYPDGLFDSPTGSPASADRLHEEPRPALGVCSRSSSGLTHPNESGVQLQLPKRTRACGDRNMGASATLVSASKCSAALPSDNRRLKGASFDKKGKRPSESGITWNLHCNLLLRGSLLESMTAIKLYQKATPSNCRFRQPGVSSDSVK